MFAHELFQIISTLASNYFKWTKRWFLKISCKNWENKINYFENKLEQSSTDSN